MSGRFRHAPIDRHDALAPLSRDHYSGLVHARRLIRSSRGDRLDRHRALASFLDGWDREIIAHFRDEERLLTGVISREDRERLLDEHRRLAEGAEHARTMRRRVDPDGARLRGLGELLERHIRWEERELFGRVQDAMTAEQLAALGRKTAAIEASRARSCRAR